jgi:predicted KAP-like P-loop ATPase
MNWTVFASKLLSMIMSWVQAGNLRNQMYVLKDQNEIMRIALEDIQRMDPEGRMGWQAKITIDKIDGRE